MRPPFELMLPSVEHPDSTSASTAEIGPAASSPESGAVVHGGGEADLCGRSTVWCTETTANPTAVQGGKTHVQMREEQRGAEKACRILISEASCPDDLTAYRQYGENRWWDAGGYQRCASGIRRPLLWFDWRTPDGWQGSKRSLQLVRRNVPKRRIYEVGLWIAD